MLITVAVVGHREFIDRTEGTGAEEPGVEIRYYRAFIDDVLPLARRLENEGVSAIVTGQGNKMVLEGRVGIPVIPFRITYEEVLQALDEVRSTGRRLALAIASFEGIDVNFKLIENLLGMEIRLISYNDAGQIEEKLAQAKADGVDAVIGTTVAVSVAQKLGLRSHPIYHTTSAVRDAVRRAVEVVRATRSEIRRSRRFAAILDFAHEGIIATDPWGTVELCNAAAGRLLQVEPADLTGMNIAQVFPSCRVLEAGEPELDVFDAFGDRVLVSNRVPIKDREGIGGAVITFQDVTRIQKLERMIRLQSESKRMTATYRFSDIVGESKAIREAVETAKRYAQSNAPILIQGETGTGKEMFAQSIHNESPRRNNAFVAVNCAAIPENLLESELFGYEEGAFTGARRGGKKGLFELAHGGTIFLDEIGSVPLKFQARLLRALEQGQVMRVGGEKMIPVDVRVIAATNEDLVKDIREGRFREDLYFRLGVLVLNLPPLRERLEDLWSLCKHMLLGDPTPSTREILSKLDIIVKPLLRYPFPGNIRELKSILQRFISLVDYSKLHDPAYLEVLMQKCIGMNKYLNSPATAGLDLSTTLREVISSAERLAIVQALEEYQGDKTLAAKRLGISRTTMYRKMEHLGIPI